MNIINALLLVYLLLIGCTLNGSNGKKFEPTFRAEINGETFDITMVDEVFVSQIAGISYSNEISFLSIFGSIYNEEMYPYKETLSISVPWNNISQYHSLGSDTTYYNDNFYWVKRAMYSEWDGDARISNFVTRSSEQGSISVNIEELPSGNLVVYGQFSFTAIVEYRGAELSQRIGQDTLHITDGEYRMLLDDR
ncbi:MAG: hypothetical protein NXI08_02985 [bacterium]|jgi:hypothetical protein|nr:hypothetical protein [bacterium]